MKNIVYIAFALALLITTSCNEEEFLREEPKANLFSDNLFQDEAGFRLGVNALLQFVRQEREDRIQSAEFGYGWKIGVDNGWANTALSWTRGLSLYDSDWNPDMQWINGFNGVFAHMYRAINSTNTIINRAENPDVDWGGTTPEENEAIKREILAHAHLIRAWAYRHLAFTFGEVPISTEEINGNNFTNNWERRPIREVQELIISDLEIAELGLAENSNNVLILSKAIAQHYMAETYLWMDEPNLAIEAAEKVLQNPNYSLITERYGVRANEPGVPFMDQFYAGNILPSQGNTEALWVFPNIDIPDQNGASANSMRRSWVVNYANYANYSPEYGGRGIGRLSITAWAFSIYEEDDDRFSEYAIRKRYVHQETGEVTETQMTEDKMNAYNDKWASTMKWDWTFSDPSLYGDTHAYGEQVYLRLADTYLLMAEAQLKANGPAAALPYLNAIRERSNATPAQVSQVDLDFILDERSRELITEEHRRHTLLRTGTFLERTRQYNPLAQPRLQDFHRKFPLPQSEIDATEMDQNQWQ